MHRPRRFAALFLSILGLGTAQVANAAAPERGWTLGPSLSTHWGTAYEIVYDTSGVPNQNDYLSLLTWDLKPVVTLGLDSRWESGRRLGMDVNLQAAVPGLPVGEMNDWDWFYTDRDWSHWSLSDVNLRWGFILDVNQDWRTVRTGPFTLRLGLGYHLDWWAWRDTIRDSVYSDLNQPDSYYPGPFPAGDGFRDTEMNPANYGKNGIDYRVAYHSLLALLAVDLQGERLFAGFTGRIGPTAAFSLDYHKLRYDIGPLGVKFYDSALGFPWVDLALEAGFRSTDGFTLRLRGEYAWLAEIRGNTVIVDPFTGDRSISVDSGGFSYRRIGVSLLGTWNLETRRPGERSS